MIDNSLSPGQYRMTVDLEVHQDGYLLPHDTRGMLRPSWWIERGATFVAVEPQPAQPAGIPDPSQWSVHRAIPLSGTEADYVIDALKQALRRDPDSPRLKTLVAGYESARAQVREYARRWNEQQAQEGGDR